MTAATVLDSEDTIETEIRRTARATKEASQILALADVATKNPRPFRRYNCGQ